MKPHLLGIALIATLTSCEKEDQPNEIVYTSYNDTIVRYNQLMEMDLDKDGEMDFLAATVYIGTLTEDRLQFRISSKLKNRILLEDEEKPAMLDYGAVIFKNNQLPYEWSAIGSAIIIERVIPYNNGDLYWEGVWKDQQKKYLPVQLVKDNGKVYNGWIRISFSDHAEPRIIVHDAAVSKTLGREIKAGQQEDE